MKLALSIFAALCLSFSSVVPAPVPDGKKDILDARATLDKAAYASDRAAVTAARERFRALTTDASVARWAFYYSALASWQLNILAVQRDRAALGRELQDCAASLRKAIELDPKFAEAHVLLSRCLGEQIQLDPRTLGPTLGRESSEALATAAALEPANPRVALLKATETFYTPEAYGGSQSRGLAEWQKALASFAAKKSSDPFAPNWGLAEGWVWLGQAYMLMDPPQPEKAHAAYEKALAARPDYRWVKEVGLPAVTAAK